MGPLLSAHLQHFEGSWAAVLGLAPGSRECARCKDTALVLQFSREKLPCGHTFIQTLLVNTQKRGADANHLRSCADNPVL